MSYHQAGEHARAKEILQELQPTLDRIEKQLDEPNALPNSWTDGMIALLVRPEAEALIQN